MAGAVAERQMVASGLAAGTLFRDAAIVETQGSTLDAIGKASGTHPIYLIPRAAGAGLFAAKWKFDSFKVTTGDLAHSLLACRTAGTAPVTRRSNGTCVRKRPTIGAVSFVSADTYAEWSMEGTCESVHVYIGRDATRTFAEQHLVTALLPRIKDFFAIEDPWLKGYFQMLICECEVFARCRQPADELFLGQTEVLLIRHLLQWHSDAGTKDMRALAAQNNVNPLRTNVMRRVNEYIEANLAGDICLGDLAALACMSVGHFMRAFRAACGTTPYHYVLEQRLQKARHMLRNTSAPVSLIAVECGFKSLTHFSTKFHARLGVSPSKYRAAMAE